MGCRAMFGAVGAFLAGFSWLGTAGAADRIEVRRDSDATVFGSCVPSFVARNGTVAPVDYMQVDVAFVLKSGETRELEFKSRYLHGVERPIAPGASARLVVHGDESRPLGAGCADIVSLRVVRMTCQTGGASCAATIDMSPDR
ncbi:MAG: hypothetical protein IPK81_12540 [Rhodospirillales bacterium]|nr:MAG: hypothetical protein IPK81_12540 [Rhodospirillales bacterium]